MFTLDGYTPDLQQRDGQGECCMLRAACIRRVNLTKQECLMEPDGAFRKQAVSIIGLGWPGP